MGIVLMSAPLLISTASKSSIVTVQQEAIAAAAAEIGMILTHHWDERDTNTSLGYAPILTTAGDPQLGATMGGAGISTGRRAGTTSTPQARSFFSSYGGNTFAAVPFVNLGNGTDVDINGNDDIDDFIQAAGVSLINILATNNTTGDYVDRTMTVAVAVNYVNDIPTIGNYAGIANTIRLDNPTTTGTAVALATSSIKRIQVIIADAAGSAVEVDKQITLNAFLCNIGMYELNRRTF